MNNKILKTSVAGIILIAFVFMVSVFSSPHAHGEKQTIKENNNKISVTGIGDVKIKPNMAKLSIAVVTKDVSSKKAIADNSDKMNLVFKSLKAFKIAEKDMQTSNFTVYKTHDNYSSNKKSVEKFEVRNTLNITIRNLAQLGDIIDGVTKAGVNNVNNLVFTHTDIDKFYNEALELAMADAKKKASTISKTFGKSVSIPISVQEVGQLHNNINYFRAESMSMKQATPVSEGEISINAKLNVEYSY